MDLQLSGTGAVLISQRKPPELCSKTGLTKFFGSIVGGDRLLSRKPDPAMLQLVMKKLAVERCLFVGDSEVDVATARAAGVPIALFTQGYRQTSVAGLAPDFDFDNFKNLPAIAKKFFALKA